MVSLVRVLALGRESAARVAKHDLRGPVAGLDTVGERLAQREARDEATHERVAGTVGVDDLRGGQRWHSVGHDLAVVRDDRGLGTLREHDGASTRARVLWQLRQTQGDLLEVVAPAVGRAELLGLALVTKHKVGVRNGSHQWVLEELHNERRRQVEHEDLVVFLGVLRELEHGSRRDGEVEASRVEDLAEMMSWR